MNQPTHFNMVLTGDELDLLGTLLAKHPFEVVAPMLQNLANQRTQQTLIHQQAIADGEAALARERSNDGKL